MAYMVGYRKKHWSPLAIIELISSIVIDSTY